MRRFAMILLLAGMLLAVGIIRAQEEETVLYISLRCDCESDFHLEVLLNELEASLQPFNIRLVIYPYGTEDLIGEDAPNIFLGSRSGSIWVEVNAESINKSLASISPLLRGDVFFSQRIGDTGCSSDYSNCSHFVDLLSIMALYSLNRCGLIEPLVEASFQKLPTDFNYQDYFIYWANMIRSNCAILASNYLEARNILEGTERLFDWYNEDTLTKLAWLYIQNEQVDAATALMDELVSIRREELEYDYGTWIPINLIISLKYRAQIYALTFDYDSAIADMDEAISLAEENEVDNTTLAELYTIRGKIIFLIYEWDRVLENFNYAIELDPNYGLAYFERGVLYYTMTQRENALADFQHYLELEPDGLYAEEAAQYIESIEIELEALGG